MYAVQADIVSAYGEDALFGARGEDNLIDPARVSRALEKASQEIDSYLAVRHNLPLPTVPDRLRDICVDMAVYHMSADADALSDERKSRHKEAVAWLKDVSRGVASLGLPKSGPSRSPRPVVTTGTPRQFSRQTMRGL